MLSAYSHASLTDASAGGAPALEWIASLLSGTVGMTVAVFAVAAFGVGALAGRLSLKRAMIVVIGIALVTSSPSLARQVASLTLTPIEPDDSGRNVPAIPQSTSTPANDADPYAGAAVAN